MLGLKRKPGAGEATTRAPVGVARRRRDELLASYWLLVVAILVAALAVTTFVQARLLRQQARARVQTTAPTIMNLAARLVRENLAGSSDELYRLANDLTRLPGVQRVELQVASRDGAPPRTLSATAVEDVGETLLQLSADLHDEAGTRLATLRVAYGAGPAQTETATVWTSAGLVGVAALLVFVSVYRVASRRVQPMTHVRDSLLAYHRGSEKALELLRVQNDSAQIAQAWNSLVDFVHTLERERDSYSCRQAVASSTRLLQTQSAQAILDAVPIGVVRIDNDGRLTYANYSAAHLLRIRTTEEELPPLAKRLGDEQLAQSILALRGAAGAAVEHRLEHGVSHTIVRLSRVAAQGEGDDEMVVLVQDISQLKEAEHSRDEFLAHITHELRTPLTNIRAYTETLTEDFFDDEQTRRECYNVIMSETRRLTHLIEDVLSVSQIEAGGVRLERAQVRVDESLRRVVQEIQAAADAKSIELALKIPSKLPSLVGDRHRLHQVWTNLIGNAVKYTPSGGSVSVDVQAEDGRLVVRVTDTGIGIPPEYHAKIFEKFFRVKDAAVEAEVGSGLGLAIAREIIRLHGGNIRVESAVGVGSTFFVELPLAGEAKTSDALEVADGANSHR